MTLTQVRMLYCGQGMMTLVEVYTGDNADAPPDYLALIDCGGSKEEASTSLAYVVKKVKHRGHLDTVVISHQDRDHVGLLEVLGPQVEGSMSPRPAQNFTEGKIYYGGDNWSKTNRATLDGFCSKVGGALMQLNRNQCHYKDLPIGALGGTSSGNVHLRILMSNVATPNMTRNSSSAVVVVDTGAHRFVLPGDATYETMREINDLGTAILSQLWPVAGLSLPHHGSGTSAREKPGSTLDILTKFAQVSTKPDYIGISAGPENRYHHPDKAVVDKFTTVRDHQSKHSYVVYDTASGWSMVETEKAIRSTVTSVSIASPSGPSEPDSPPKKRTKVAPTRVEDVLVWLRSSPSAAEIAYHENASAFRSDVADVVLYAPAP